MTKIYCDIADIDQIKKFNRIDIVKGFTTNPTLMRKAGARNYTSYSKKILEISNKPISLEVFADNEKDMIAQALKICKWGQNVYVKVPVVNSKGKFMGKVIKYLNSRKIKLNITAVYTSEQTKRILKQLNKNTNVIISIFAGRMSDVGKDPIPEIKKSIKLARTYKNVKILWASTREPYNYTQAKMLKCHIITAPPKIISQIKKFNKSFKKLTVDTVKTFLIDANKSKFKI